jgi:hypothetical protein
MTAEADAHDLAALADEASLLRRSLEDLDREHAAGDVGDADYERLRSKYARRAGEVASLLAVQPARSAPSARPGDSTPSRRSSRRLATPRSRTLLGWAAFMCFVAAAGLLSADLAGVGPFASTPPLSPAARVQIMLAEASILGGRGNLAQAVATYDEVLALDPRQPVALANGGWLSRLAGLRDHDVRTVRNGDAEIEAAARLDPGYALARAYAGVVELVDRHDAAAAAAEFRAMAADRPSKTLLRQMRPYEQKAFQRAATTHG